MFYRGKNVCAFFLYGCCNRGSACYYSHETSYLPKIWASPSPPGLEYLSHLSPKQRKFAIENLIKAARTTLLGHELTEGKSNSKRKTRQGARSSQRSKYRYRYANTDSDDDYDTEKEAERARNCGFTNDEVYELMLQGVKPWDDDAAVSFFIHQSR